MAWERNFEDRVLRVRDKELKYQRRNYIIEVRSALTSKYSGDTRVLTHSISRFSSMPFGKPSSLRTRLSSSPGSTDLRR